MLPSQGMRYGGSECVRGFPNRNTNTNTNTNTNSVLLDAAQGWLQDPAAGWPSGGVTVLVRDCQRQDSDSDAGWGFLVARCRGSLRVGVSRSSLSWFGNMIECHNGTGRAVRENFECTASEILGASTGWMAACTGSLTTGARRSRLSLLVRVCCAVTRWATAPATARSLRGVERGTGSLAFPTRPSSRTDPPRVQPVGHTRPPQVSRRSGS
eukprot:3428271-Rhodomonas_salina.5